MFADSSREDFPPELAEAHADALLFAMRGGTLTKLDLQEFEGRVKEDFHLQEKTTESVRTELKGEIASLDRKIESVRTELKGEIASLDRKIESVRTELKEEIHSVRTELKEEIHSVRTELKEEIDLSRREIREMETRMTLRFGLMLSAGLGLLLTLEKFLK
jgi:LPS O-antigen subunit length determinant protein (WzzB/FepE family)